MAETACTLRSTWRGSVRFLQDHDFLPLGAPLLDFLIEELKSIDGWKYLRIEELELYQEHRGLSFEMLNRFQYDLK